MERNTSNWLTALDSDRSPGMGVFGPSHAGPFPLTSKILLVLDSLTMMCLLSPFMPEFLDFVPCSLHQLGSFSVSDISCVPPHHTDQRALHAVFSPLSLTLLLGKVSAAVSSILLNSPAGSGFAVFPSVSPSILPVYHFQRLSRSLFLSQPCR